MKAESTIYPSKAADTKSSTNHTKTALEILLPSIIPRIGNPKWKRSFLSEDISAQKVADVTSSTSSSSSSICSSITICPTCKINQARYTCPRCLAPYCSISCYRIHDVPPQQAQQQQGQDCIGGGKCTESFYRDRVVTMNKVNLVNEEKDSNAMSKILSRLSKQDDIGDDDNDEISNIESIVSNSSHHDGNRSSSNLLTDEELSLLAQHVLNPNEVEVVSKEDILPKVDSALSLDNLPQSLIEKFEMAVKRGDLSHLIQQWQPFWLTEYSNNSHTNNRRDEVGNDGDDDKVLAGGDDGTAITTTTTLWEERILSIQPFTKLKQPTSRANLQYNMIELIYNTAYVLRLYNGTTFLEIDEIASDLINNYYYDSIEEEKISVSSSLYNISKVLSEDARYLSTSEVMMICSKHSSEDEIRRNGHNHKNDDNDKGSMMTDWKVLLKDVISICKWKRTVLRLLLCSTIDILNYGYRSIREKDKKERREGSKQQYGERRKENRQHDGMNHKVLQLAKKKVEFYTSWCLSYWDLVKDEISNDLTQWGKDWILECKDEKNFQESMISDSITSTSVTSLGKKKKETSEVDINNIEDEVLFKSISTRML